jgi:hypothetical protein
MSFRKNEWQQISMTDRLNNLTERQLNLLKKSWSEVFSNYIFPKIDESIFEVLYCADNGRPNTPVNVIVGSLILKEAKGLNDKDLVDEVIFNTLFQNALHLTSFEEIPYSDRTPSRFREKVLRHEMETGEDLIKMAVKHLGEEAITLLKIHPDLNRTDSLMVSSSCKNMGRLELIYTCIADLVKLIIQVGEIALLPAKFLEYTEENKNAMCYRLKSEEVVTRLETVTSDALLLRDLCEDNFTEFKEYQLLSRMLGDQTKDGQLKPAKEISPQSLQNPSDPDATFRRKAGNEYQGYVANVVETCGETGNIISDYDFDINRHSDIEFGAELIKHMGLQEEKQVLIADGAYASEENFEAAAQNNIELVTTNLIGEKPPEIVLEFHIEDEQIKTCPAGHAPKDCTYNTEKEIYRAHFDKTTCENCPRRHECPIIMQKRQALIKLSTSTISRAEYARKLSTKEYKAYARKRNGVEGVPSILRRRYGVDNMPVRGLLRTKMWFGFKIGAINIKRVIAATLLCTFSEFVRIICKKMVVLWKAVDGKRLRLDAA